jgi:fumarate hydratase class I
MAEFAHHPMFPVHHDDTPWRRLDGDFVGLDSFRGREVVTVDPEALTEQAMHMPGAPMSPTA